MSKSRYQRYHIETTKAPNLIPHPHPFKVKVNRFELAKLLIQEIIKYRGNWEVISSRPCVYGVFSGPVGGFAPRENLCVGCLRCTTEYPKVVQILPNGDGLKLGDEYFTPHHVDTVVYEAETGRIPIRGAGYRGTFGGTGFDGMWTDMSEIVRPTRDGIHGREFISTQVDLGKKTAHLQFEGMELKGELPKAVSIPLPLLFDALPDGLLKDKNFCQLLLEAGSSLKTYSIIPYKWIARHALKHAHLIPLIGKGDVEDFIREDFSPAFIEMSEWDAHFFEKLSKRFPNSLLILRTNYEDELLSAYFRSGIRLFHLTANYHGRGERGAFVLELIQKAHKQFAGVRDEISLIGSGGIIAAEHFAKSILLGLDAVALDTPLLVALQAAFGKDCHCREKSEFILPKKLTVDWGKDRLRNLAAAWRDQLLEILSAMGLREVRRMRGEMGRAMFQKVLEKEAFQGIEGFNE